MRGGKEAKFEELSFHSVEAQRSVYLKTYEKRKTGRVMNPN